MNTIGMRPIHPGEILEKEFLEPWGITAAGLACSLSEFKIEIVDLVAQSRGVSPGLAKRLSIHLNTTPEFWLNLQSSYELRSAERN